MSLKSSKLNIFFPHKVTLKKTALHSLFYVAILVLVGGVLVSIDRKSQIKAVKDTEYFDIMIKSEHFDPFIKKNVQSLVSICDEYKNGYINRKDQFVEDHEHFFKKHSDYERLIFINRNGQKFISFIQEGSEPIPHSELNFISDNFNRLRVNTVFLRYDVFAKKSNLDSNKRAYLITGIKEKNGQVDEVAIWAINIDNLLKAFSKKIIGNIGKTYLLNHTYSRYIPITNDEHFESKDIENLDFIKSAGVIDFLNKNTRGQTHFASGLITFDRIATTAVKNGMGYFRFNDPGIDFFFQNILLISFVPTQKLHQLTFDRIKTELLLFIFGALFILLLNYLYNAARYSQEQSDQKLLDQANQVQAQAHMATLGELSAGIAHEINNPLTILVSATEEILHNVNSDNISKEQLIEDAVVAKETTFRIADIVKGMRSATRNAENDPYEAVAVKSIVNDAVVISQIKLKKHKVKLTIEDIPEDLFIECRAAQISQVLLNIVGNAIDAISEKPSPWINLKVEDAADIVSVIITDSGEGIAFEVTKNLFNQFFTTKKKGEGTGLGLFISKKIVESHRGSLTLNCSCPNTQFVVSLPKNQRDFASG